jgi:hypothetical protein
MAVVPDDRDSFGIFLQVHDEGVSGVKVVLVSRISQGDVSGSIDELIAEG